MMTIDELQNGRKELSDRITHLHEFLKIRKILHTGDSGFVSRCPASVQHGLEFVTYCNQFRIGMVQNLAHHNDTTAAAEHTDFQFSHNLPHFSTLSEPDTQPCIRFRIVL